MSSKSSKKKKKKKLQRYYKNGKNVYPYAKASRVLWGLGFTVTIFAGLTITTQVIMFLLQKLALMVQEQVGVDSKLGTKLENFIQIELPLGLILKALLAVLLFIAVAYMVTIAFRHHEGELQPFKDDRMARTIRRDVIKNLELNVLDYDDKGKVKNSKQDVKARDILRRMAIEVHTRKEVNGSDFLSIATVKIERPKNKAIRKVLEGTFFKDLPSELTFATEELFAFSERLTEKEFYFFEAKAIVTEEYVYKIEEAQKKLQEALGKGKKSDGSDEVEIIDTGIFTEEKGSWDIEVLHDKKLQEKIVEQTKLAEEEVANLYLSLETFISSNEKVNLQFVSMRATNSNAQFVYTKPKGVNNMGTEQMKENLESDLGKQDINITLRAGQIIIQIPLDNKITADAYTNYKKAFIGKKNLPPLQALVGVDTEGLPRTYDLATAPHILTAGTTGSGKSVGINMIYLSIILHNSPDVVKFIIIDPKKTEFTPYKKSPYLYTDVITDMDGAKNAFNAVVTEMERRNSLFEKIGVRNLQTYNQKVSPDKREPYLILIADEVADLIMTNGDEVEDSMQRLGQKARSAGILIHIATQTPRADIIKGKIKANLPSQIVYKVANSIESDIAIGESGAERLLGKGDTYVKWSDNPSLVRVQGVFLTDENINDIIDSTIQKYPDERYYNERVPMDAFEDGFIKPKDLGDISKGAVYRYAIKHQKSHVIDVDMDEQEVVTPIQEKPTGTPVIASAQPYETKSLHKEAFEEFRKRLKEKNEQTALELDDILGTRNRKVEALVKQMELDKEKEQEKDTPKLDHEVEEVIEERVTYTEPEAPVDKETIANELYPDEPTPTEEGKKDNSILPKPIPKDWKFRKTGNRGKI
jgi:DNA segregation ATPase FtsK/SpoIIIE and related proteins